MLLIMSGLLPQNRCYKAVLRRQTVKGVEERVMEDAGLARRRQSRFLTRTIRVKKKKVLLPSLSLIHI